MEIEELVSLFRHQTLDSPKLTILHRTLKAARLAMADRVVLSRTNTELLAANTRLGPDLIYGSNSVTVRSLPKNKKRDNSTFSKAFQDFLRIAPNIF